MLTSQIPYTSTVFPNESFNGVVPGWEEEAGSLFAVVSAQVSTEREDFRTSNGFDGMRNVTWKEYTVRPDTLLDITSEFNITTGRPYTGLAAQHNGFRIFTFYQRLSGNRNVHFESERHDTIFDDGSFAVDHNSARGAQTVIDFWENYILDDEVLRLIRAAGNYSKDSR